MPKPVKTVVESAIYSSNTWVEVAVQLGMSKKAGAKAKELASFYEIDSNHIVSHMAPVNKQKFENPYPNKIEVNRLALRRSAIGVAIDWFLAQGYPPSLPVEVERYDLVVESQLGFRRVQVKTSENIRNTESKNYMVLLATTTYDSKTTRYVQRPYTKQEVDDFFIVCSDGSKYLIPIEATNGKAHINVTSKFREFLID